MREYFRNSSSSFWWDLPFSFSFQLKNKPGLGFKRFEVEGSNVILYFDEVSLTLRNSCFFRTYSFHSCIYTWVAFVVVVVVKKRVIKKTLTSSFLSVVVLARSRRHVSRSESIRKLLWRKRNLRLFMCTTTTRPVSNHLSTPKPSSPPPWFPS